MAGSESKHARIVGTEAKLVQKSVSWVQAAEQEAADFQPLETEDDDDDTVNRGRKNALPGTLRINCSKTAVLFIEFQNDFVHRKGELTVQGGKIKPGEQARASPKGERIDANRTAAR